MKTWSWFAIVLGILFVCPLEAGDYKLSPSRGLDPPAKLRELRLKERPKLGGYEGLEEQQAGVAEQEKPERKGITMVMIAVGMLLVLVAFKEAFS